MNLELIIVNIEIIVYYYIKLLHHGVLVATLEATLFVEKSSYITYSNQDTGHRTQGHSWLMELQLHKLAK